MDSYRWDNIKRVFAGAAEAPPAGREAILVLACGDDATLRQYGVNSRRKMEVEFSESIVIEKYLDVISSYKKAS